MWWLICWSVAIVLYYPAWRLGYRVGTWLDDRNGRHRGVDPGVR